ncbi:MAG: short-chain dehydrogenase/reductase [Collimonas fungivorans]|uniref:SDR family NAD(P)-dependent oxidoreductase n=1 Tax=Collimonas fungivorans TaxID=158899 RepID=UPI0026EE079D|nr:SDR family NAD(P)-dependent oxidoreductase [Collimonas fungivorans]MDB5768124.1 short-chain dehydrogenase/reductase [Collimonas fungivorans]
MITNPTVVVTGATSGIGQLAAIALARQGAHIVFTARNEAKAAATCAAIKAAAPDARVDVHYADFTSLDAVARVAHEIAARYERIDVLVNNAGLHAFEQRITADGFSEMVGVNYLAPWLLTNILREKLASSAPSRIVTVASEASRRSGDLDPLRDICNTAAFTRLGSSRIYGQTKLMNIMFSMELARQLEGSGVTANCLCPGFNVTGLGRELGFAAVLQGILKALNIGNPQHGAGIIVRLASDPAFDRISGGYFSVKDAKPLVPAGAGNDVAARQALWSVTSELLAERLAIAVPGMATGAGNVSVT